MSVRRLLVSERRNQSLDTTDVHLDHVMRRGVSRTRAGLTPRGTRSPAGSTIGTPSPKKNGTVHHPVVADTRLLLWMTNQNTITQHVWTSRIPRLNHPDLCVFDLDPSTDDPASIRAAAVSLRDLLSELGLRSWVNTSGSRGFHIVAPLNRFIALVGHRSTNVIET